MTNYRVGDVVIYRPRGEPDCYSPVARRWAPWPSPFWHRNPGTARPGDRMPIVHVDVVAGQQRLWYESPYAVYGPAPRYASANDGVAPCHNVMAADVRPSGLTRIALFLRAKEDAS